MGSSTMSIKCKISNMVHKTIDPGYGIKRSERSETRWELSDEEKIKRFDDLVKFYRETSEELSNCLRKNRKRNRMRKARLIRSQEEYLAWMYEKMGMLKNNFKKIQK